MTCQEVVIHIVEREGIIEVHLFCFLPFAKCADEIFQQGLSSIVIPFIVIRHGSFEFILVRALLEKLLVFAATQKEYSGTDGKEYAHLLHFKKSAKLDV